MMFTRFHVVFGLLVALILVGCEEGQVLILDENGTPIEGAEVEPVSLSMNGRPEKTNAQGIAKVPLFIGQDVVWIKASKAGYQTQQVDRPDDWPLVIKLEAVPE